MTAARVLAFAGDDEKFSGVDGVTYFTISLRIGSAAGSVTGFSFFVDTATSVTLLAGL